MSAVLTLSALAMSLIVTEAKLRSAKRSSEAVRNLSRALRSSRTGLAGAALRTVLTLLFLRSISLFSWWVIALLRIHPSVRRERHMRRLGRHDRNSCHAPRGT